MFFGKGQAFTLQIITVRDKPLPYKSNYYYLEQLNLYNYSPHPPLSPMRGERVSLPTAGRGEGFRPADVIY